MCWKSKLEKCVAVNIMMKVAQTDFHKLDRNAACARKIEKCVAANIMTKVVQNDFEN